VSDVDSPCVVELEVESVEVASVELASVALASVALASVELESVELASVEVASVELASVELALESDSDALDDSLSPVLADVEPALLASASSAPSSPASGWQATRVRAARHEASVVMRMADSL
jgi:hypothetical protein